MERAVFGTSIISANAKQQSTILGNGGRHRASRTSQLESYEFRPTALPAYWVLRIQYDRKPEDSRVAHVLVAAPDPFAGTCSCREGFGPLLGAQTVGARISNDPPFNLARLNRLIQAAAERVLPLRHRPHSASASWRCRMAFPSVTFSLCADVLKIMRSAWQGLADEVRPYRLPANGN